MRLTEARSIVEAALVEASAAMSAGFRALDAETVAALAELWDSWRSKPSWERRGEGNWYDQAAVKDVLGLAPTDRIPRFIKRLRRSELP